MQGFKFSGVAPGIANLTEHLPLNIEIREKRYACANSILSLPVEVRSSTSVVYNYAK
jgi:hypothetical protein